MTALLSSKQTKMPVFILFNIEILESVGLKVPQFDTCASVCDTATPPHADDAYNNQHSIIVSFLFFSK